MPDFESDNEETAKTSHCPAKLPIPISQNSSAPETNISQNADIKIPMNNPVKNVVWNIPDSDNKQVKIFSNYVLFL